jgi:hypothetical protein
MESLLPSTSDGTDSLPENDLQKTQSLRRQGRRVGLELHLGASFSTNAAIRDVNRRFHKRAPFVRLFGGL